jgi:hypothetical protein
MTRTRITPICENGAIEGLPLQLLIMVIVAGVVIVILLAWLAPWQSASDLTTVTVTPQSITKDTQTTVTVTAWDTKDNTLSGVLVTVEGCDVGVLTNTTGSDGKCSFNLEPHIPGTSGTITVTARYTGTIETVKTTTIVVS